jgi:predicted MPP superfamily phosphohydrolase
MRPTTAIPLGLAAAGAAGLAYAAGYEVRAFRLRRYDVPLLPHGARPLRVLHISDLHLRPGQQRKREWVRSLAAVEPDLVVNTGDNFGHIEAIPVILDALGPLLERPGVFVFGSNDYYSPVLKNPGGYLLGPSNRKAIDRQPDLPSGELRDALVDAGWTHLANSRAHLKIDGRELAFAGVDDPHVHRDRYEEVAGRADPGADLTIGVAHAPYRRVLDRMAADRYQLILAGHTHGGQLCVPFYGALVTNCDLDRRRARGLSRYGADANDPDAAWLHVSAGLGTSPFAPVRFACPPEATLLNLVPQD